MPFEKGISGNPAGRPPGKTNQSDIKQAYQDLIEDNLPRVENWLNDVAANNPAKALDFILRLSEFILPKMKSTDLKTDLNDNIIVVMPPEPNFTDEERKERISELKQKLFESV